MLELKDVALQVGNAPDEPELLSEVSARFPKKHFAAILGPSGCGKSTLLKVIAGLHEQTDGHLEWEGRNLAEDGDLAAHEIGYVPQFSIAYDGLTVWESVETALKLRVGVPAESAEVRLERILRDVGLDEIEDRRVALLSGGQKRRLALALEMVSAPHLLLCDEVTSGLDPKAEDEIVKLMHHLSRLDDRVVLSVTHSLRHLSLYDSVLVLYQGRVAYHGAPNTLYHYFGVDQPEELFPRLASRKADDWHRSWLKHRTAYYHAGHLDSGKGSDAEASEAVSQDPKDRLKYLFEKLKQEGSETKSGEENVPPEDPTMAARPRPQTKNLRTPSESTPSRFTQFRVLLGRRWKLFFRDRGQVALQCALLFGFPFLVVIFALDGLPQIKSLALPMTGNLLTQIQSEFAQQEQMSKTGSLVSGLVMFQVILLALMGANNSAREIASERLIFEKEKFAGLRPSAYVASKAAFLAVLVLAQSLWMGIFVNWIVRFPGEFGSQLVLLILVNASLTAICLGISSFMKTAEQASLVSVYLVGFQLPLSGAVLALPGILNSITRPFIASYWGWSGFIHTMRDTRAYEATLKVTQTHLSSVPLCLWMLTFHILLGLLLSWIGSRNSRWE